VVPGIPPAAASAIRRILRVIRAANRHVKPPEVKKLWSQKPASKNPTRGALTASSSLVQPIDVQPSKELLNITRTNTMARSKSATTMKKGSGAAAAVAALATNPLASSVRPVRTPQRRSNPSRKSRARPRPPLGTPTSRSRSEVASPSPVATQAKTQKKKKLPPQLEKLGALGGSSRSLLTADESLGWSDSGVDSARSRPTTARSGKDGKLYMAIVDPPTVDEWWDDDSQAAVVALHRTIGEMREKLHVMTGACTE